MSGKRLYRYVLTGGASCGKSTTARFLADQGHIIVPEAARIVLDKNRIEGKPFELQTEAEIFMLHRELENLSTDLVNKLDGKRIFLDRGLLDCWAYSKYFFNKIPESFRNYNHQKYDLVFIFDRIPLIKDSIRLESDDSQVEAIHNALKQEYQNKGYSLINVPLFPSNSLEESVRKRGDFILDKVRRYEDAIGN